ncbi:MAG: hypothetical protein ACOYJV_07805, partial [Aminivibrio sp.]
MRQSGKIGFEKALVGEKGKRLLLYSFCIILCLFGLSIESPAEIMKGLWKIIIEPDYLVTDYMEVGGMG